MSWHRRCSQRNFCKLAQRMQTMQIMRAAAGTATHLHTDAVTSTPFHFLAVVCEPLQFWIQLWNGQFCPLARHCFLHQARSILLVRVPCSRARTMKTNAQAGKVKSTSRHLDGNRCMPGLQACTFVFASRATCWIQGCTHAHSERLIA